MKSNDTLYNRKAVTIYDNDSSVTFMKPNSGEYSREHLIVIYEDAYGRMEMKLEAIEDLILRADYNFCDVLHKIDSEFYKNYNETLI